MMFKKLMSAAVAGVLSVTSLALPTAYDQLSAVVTAAETKDDTIKQSQLPYDLKTSASTTSKTRKGNFEIPSTMRNSTQITITLKSTYKETVSLSVYGFGISKDPWWVDEETKFDDVTVDDNGLLEITVDVPEDIQGKVNKVGLGIWWPQAGQIFTVMSVEGNVISDPEEEPETGDADLYVSKNDKSGKASFVDNKDGTAEATATLAAQYKLGEDTEFSVALNDRTKSNYEFDLKNFGIDDIDSVQFQSFQFVVRTKSDDTYIKELQYKGDISVKPAEGSTKKVYTDEEAYTAKYCGNYAKLVWDVPADVQPTVDGSGSVGFNFESAVDTGDEDISNITIESCTAVYTKKMTVPYTETISDTEEKTIAVGKKANLAIEDLLKLSRHDNLSAVKFTFTSAKEMQKFVGGLGVSLDEDKMGDTWYDSGNFCALDPEKEFEIMWIPTKEVQAGIWGGKSSKIQLGYWYGDDHEGKKISSVTLKSVDYYLYRFPERDLVVTDDKEKVIEKKLEVEEDSEFKLNMSIEGCTFASSEESVAFVDDGGIIHALKAGETEINIKTPAGQDVKFVLTVTAKPVVTTATTAVSTSETTTSTTVSTEVSTVDSSATTSSSTKATTASESVSKSESQSTSATTVSSTKPTTASTETSKSTSKTTASSSTSASTSASTRPTTASTASTSATTKATTTVKVDLSGVKIGDVDLSGLVDLADVTKLAKFILSNVSYPLGGTEPGSDQKAEYAADVNGDKQINILDLSKLIEFNLGSVSL